MKQKVFDVEQGTKKWHILRLYNIGSSEAPHLMNKLHYNKTRGAWIKEKAMTRATFETDKTLPKEEKSYIFSAGHNKAESMIRNVFELNMQMDFSPATLGTDAVQGMIASLDGWNKENNLIWECKMVGVKVVEAFKEAKKIEKDHKFYPQLQHQMFVANAKMVYLNLCGFDGRKIVPQANYVLEVQRDERYIKRLTRKVFLANLEITQLTEVYKNEE